MKALLRWLISITEARAPFHSSSSVCAGRNTSSGSAAGPALKLYARLTEYSWQRRSEGSFRNHYAAPQQAGNGSARFATRMTAAATCWHRKRSMMDPGVRKVFGAAPVFATNNEAIPDHAQIRRHTAVRDHPGNRLSRSPRIAEGLRARSARAAG